MRYHDITIDDMKNGDGLRVVLWLAGCNHRCKGCQNPLTWNPEDGLIFDEKAKNELYKALNKPYISGITFSGGDPLHPANRDGVLKLILDILTDFSSGKTIWIYTGYTWEEIKDDQSLMNVVSWADILVDGKFVEELKEVNYPWAGSTNQRVIDIQKSLEKGCVVLHESH